ncbi:MAG: LysR family transcriptional regulator [Pseudomonadota bacterium]
MNEAFGKNERMAHPEQLRSFLTIAEMGNLTLASGRLNRTQSAVSAQIKNLEQDLGVQLFSRVAKGMVLSRQGEQFLPHAKAALSSMDALKTLFKDPLSGVVRVGIPDDFEDGRLERVLVDFAQEHPDVEVNVSSGCSQGFAEAIERNELDIAVASGPTFLDGVRLYEENLVWARAKEAASDPEGPVPLAVVDHGCWFARVPKGALMKAGKPYRVAFSSGSFASICASVEAGLAVSMLPERVLTEGMAVLGESDGFPKLPKLRRTILHNDLSPAMVLDAMSTSMLGLAQALR